MKMPQVLTRKQPQTHEAWRAQADAEWREAVADLDAAMASATAALRHARALEVRLGNEALALGWRSPNYWLDPRVCGALLDAPPNLSAWSRWRLDASTQGWLQQVDDAPPAD